MVQNVKLRKKLNAFKLQNCERWCCTNYIALSHLILVPGSDCFWSHDQDKTIQGRPIYQKCSNCCLQSSILSTSIAHQPAAHRNGWPCVVIVILILLVSYLSRIFNFPPVTPAFVLFIEVSVPHTVTSWHKRQPRPPDVTRSREPREVGKTKFNNSKKEFRNIYIYIYIHSQGKQIYSIFVLKIYIPSQFLRLVCSQCQVPYWKTKLTDKIALTWFWNSRYFSVFPSHSGALWHCKRESFW